MERSLDEFCTWNVGFDPLTQPVSHWFNLLREKRLALQIHAPVTGNLVFSGNENRACVGIHPATMHEGVAAHGFMN